VADANEERINAYADALFEVARAEGSLGRVEDELFSVARTIETNDALREALTDQAIPIERRQGIVEDLLGGRASPVTTSLVSFVIGAGRARDLPKIIDRLVEKAAESRSEEVAEVRTAVPLDEDQRQRLAAALSKHTGKKVSLQVVVDPSIVGGVVAQIGDTVIDGSIRGRLERLKEQL
jgi:F-type H+-transporting ATPase subunit delta